ncbi:rCG44965 [Rattus norvegicus]|uniref:RCG44965 n=1 Tax=Rattus norvegicus TaxID=10116 RepID=A6KK01_RAT|nr:rCG44965 [Rattus norvegicus]
MLISLCALQIMSSNQYQYPQVQAIMTSSLRGLCLGHRCRSLRQDRFHTMCVCSALLGLFTALSDCPVIFNKILKLYGRLSCDSNDLSELDCHDGGPVGNICQQLSDSGPGAEPRSSNRHPGWMPEGT